jgi:hypothetical protein
MRMRRDISDYLSKWPYDKSNSVRIIKGKDGRDKVQVRNPFGIEQFEADGRPDGKRPRRRESLLDYYLGQLEDYRKVNGGLEIGFQLDSVACEGLKEESSMFYHRYSNLFGVDFRRVLRDTNHNIQIFDLVYGYAVDSEERLYYEEWRPYIIRMNRDAQVHLYMNDKEYDRALEHAVNAVAALHKLPPVVLKLQNVPVHMLHPEFAKQMQISLHVLDERIKEIKLLKEKEKPKAEKIRKKLKKAVDSEDFEKAARLRDQIKSIGGDSRLN